MGRTNGHRGPFVTQLKGGNDKKGKPGKGWWGMTNLTRC